ncbi:OLC1v1027540C1 [Oldenlandia corymbosa var. corymbosa]|nr:OLC1v1027540C1 [Oldenlandia corymbosa var. corymbosa]
MESEELFKSSSSSIRDSAEIIPSLIRHISENEVEGFDVLLQGDKKLSGQEAIKDDPVSHPLSLGIESAAEGMKESSGVNQSQRTEYVSISMPPSPKGNAKKVLFSDNSEVMNGNGAQNPTASSNVAGSDQPKGVKFHSQPMPTGRIPGGAEIPPPRNPAIQRLKDNRFDSFKTWSGKLERQISNIRGRRQEPEQQDSVPAQNLEVETLPASRYFDALQGPELDTLRPSEQILLPEDKLWPFLLRFPISSFGICLGVSSQAIMWKALATSASTKFLHISLDVNLVLWFISVALLVIIFCIYFLKLVFYFEAVRREYYHPIRVNFFFAPWIALLFLVLGLPPSICENPHGALWYALMAPIFVLELKIYGQWMSGGQRRLSKVANPSNHLSVVGNFVGALLGASMGLTEGPIFFFAVGLAHYTVLFVTLYQRLPTNETLPKELHPVFFLFVAAPSVASMAWARIQGSFDYGSRIAYFIAMFLYLSLAVRINFFRGFRFSLAWWAYTFPMTGAAIATIRYSTVVTTLVTKCLTVILCSVSTLTVTGLLVTTIIHAFVLRDLFPNDIAIAISERRPKTSHRHWFHRRNGSSDTTKDIENYLKFVNSADEKDIEASMNATTGSTSEEDNKSSSAKRFKKDLQSSLSHF